MRNAHQRFGILEYTKRMKDTTTQIRLRLDRFVGEVEKDRSRIHVFSILGGDSDVGAIWAAVKEESLFTVQGPGVARVTASLGEDAQCFRGSISIAGRRPIRHLVAISAEVATTRPGADREGNRTVLCNDDPTFVLYRVARRFGLPVVPDWAGWFTEELGRRGAASPLLGLGCSPVLVRGTKRVFLKWIGRALRRKQIRFPEENGPVRWTISNSFFRVGEIGETDLEEESLQDTSKESSTIPAELEDTTLCESH
jgi:hypothetical protein